MNKTITIDYQEYNSVAELPDADAALLRCAIDATEGAYAPYSHFRVGAALRLADGTLFEGTWERGKPHGEMLVVMPNLDRHHARFSHGRRVGVSTIEYINGDLYCGETNQQGLPDGMGTYTTAAGKARTGYWSEGKYKGRRRPALRDTKH